MNIGVTYHMSYITFSPNQKRSKLNRGLSGYILSKSRDVSQMQKKFNATSSERCQQYPLTSELRGVQRDRTSCQGAAMWSVHGATA
jgi:hypothetical protein